MKPWRLALNFISLGRHSISLLVFFPLASNRSFKRRQTPCKYNASFGSLGNRFHYAISLYLAEPLKSRIIPWSWSIDECIHNDSFGATKFEEVFPRWFLRIAQSKSCHMKPLFCLGLFSFIPEEANKYNDPHWWEPHYVIPVSTALPSRFRRQGFSHYWCKLITSTPDPPLHLSNICMWRQI